jgi:hypothetical protein
MSSLRLKNDTYDFFVKVGGGVGGVIISLAFTHHIPLVAA